MPRHQLLPLIRAWVTSKDSWSLALKSWHGERMLAVLDAPVLVAVEQLGRGDFEAGYDFHLLGNKPFQVVHFLLPALCG